MGVVIMARGKPGAPKGHVGNPLGKNQYVDKAGEGILSGMIGFRVPVEVKEKIKEAAKTRNQTISEWLLDCVIEKIDCE
jgi:hypothetical protein